MTMAAPLAPPFRLYRWLQPALEDIELAAQVNAMLPAHASVTPARRESEDETVIYVMVFAYLDARKPVEREWQFFDAGELYKEVMIWINEELPRYRAADNWVIAH